jgi:hypothetical protein
MIQVGHPLPQEFNIPTTTVSLKVLSLDHKDYFLDICLAMLCLGIILLMEIVFTFV